MEETYQNMVKTVHDYIDLFMRWKCTYNACYRTC